MRSRANLPVFLAYCVIALLAAGFLAAQMGGEFVLGGYRVSAVFKSASDLGLPLVAVGLFYRESYFRQRLDRYGTQHAEYLRSPAELLPAQPARSGGQAVSR